MAQAVRRLTALYEETAEAPPVAAGYEYWRRYRKLSAPKSPAESSGFVQHTYLALLSRLVACHFLEPSRTPANREELWQVVNGDYFVGFGLENFVSEDFFTWPFFRRSMGISPDDEALDVMSELSAELSHFDFAEASPSLLTGLFNQISLQQETVPRWLAEFLLEERLDLAQRPDQSVLDPLCGAGTLLAAAVGTKVRSFREQGQEPLDIFLRVTVQVAGMTPDPLAATIARTAYLLALGELPREPHPPVLVPVYLADAGQESTTGVDAADSPVHYFAMADDLPLPNRVASDPMMLDWLFGRLPNYMRGAAARLHAQPEEVAVQEVLNAYYNYLTSPKARTPIPEALTPAAADIMVETARKLVSGYLHGEGHARLYIVKNAPAPMFLAQRKFDLLVGSNLGDGVAPGPESFESFRPRYLNETGRAAVISPASGSGPRQFEYAVAEPGQVLTESNFTLRVDGDLPADDQGWAEIKDLNLIEVDAP